jgi:hypothetical protein
MNTQWQDFLSSQHARIIDGVAHDFGDAAAERAAAESGDIVCDLAQFGLLRVSGEDAQTFLQKHAAKGQIVTGLLYVDPEADDLHAHLNTVETPLNTLDEKTLCPG